MSLLDLFLIAVGLSMDAFAVALCKGLGMKKLNARNTAIIALFFGGFQALMPLIGWVLGRQFERYITTFDHWIAFGLLALIGGKMIAETFEADSCPTDGGDTLQLKRLTILAIATSIDALAAGLSFAFLQVSILPAVAFIGIVTFALSCVGVLAGHRFGLKFRKAAELAGGIVLILIGLKILLEHSGVL